VRCGVDLPPDAKFCLQCGQAAGAAPAQPSAPAVSAASVNPPPTSLASGRYRVQRFLGEGAKKRVYLARDTRLDRDVAVAVIKTEGLDEAGLTRVRREAQAMGRLGSHPSIVTVHDIGDEHGQPFIVQELMDGGSLADLIHASPDRRLDVPTALRLAQEIANALGYAHARGVVHRDVKPGNVWLTADRRAKLGDFGLAVALDHTRLTQAGVMLGTVAYLPPEQALGGQITARADLYSLGAMLYEMLTGRPPFPGDDTVSIISQHLNTPPLPPSLLNPQVPEALDSCVLRLLAKSPDDRPAAAGEVSATLLGISQLPAEAAKPPTPSVRSRPRGVVRSPFVAREKELSQLKERLEDAIGGRGFLMMVVGEPGIGKTRLGEELAVHARLRGAQVLVGQCDESDGAPPYIPFVELLRQYMSGRSNDDLRQEMGDAASDLAKLVSEIRTRIPDVPRPAQDDPEAARYRLLESVTSFLVNASAAKPLLVTLEDLHWADRPSLLLLQHLARRLAHSRILVVGTYRDVELDRRHPLSDILGQLRRERLYERVLLRGLTAEGVRAFIAARAGMSTNVQQEIPRQFAEIIHQQTEGNPFFMEETILHLVDTGAIYLQDGRWQGDPGGIAQNVPEGVREVIGRRLSRLGEAANQALSFASVLGREFDFDVLLALTEMDEAGLLAALEDALAAQLISEHRGGGGTTYRFSHALVQETLYGELSLARRQRIHLKAARALEELRATRIDSMTTQLAHHYYQGNDRDKAIAYSRRAGDGALRVYAWEEAVRHWNNALELMEDGPANDEDRASLLQAFGDLTYLAGSDDEKGVRALEQALAIYDRRGDRGKTAGVHSRLGRRMVSFGDRLDLQRGERHLEAARAILEQDAPESAALAYVYVGICTLCFWTLENDRALDLAQRALAIGEKLGSRPVIAHAQIFLGFALVRQGRLRAGLDLIERAQRIGEAENLAFVTFLGASFLGGFHFGTRRDPRTGNKWARRELAKPHQATASLMHSTIEGGLGMCLVLAGEMDEAHRIAEGNPFGGLIRQLDVARGAWDAVADAEGKLLQEAKRGGNANMEFGASVLLAGIALHRGDHGGAVRHLRVPLELEERCHVPAWTGMRHRALLARALAQGGELVEANQHVDWSLALLSNGEDWGGTPGLIATARGVVRTAEANWTEAEHAFDEAVAIARRYGIPWDEADALQERARMHLARRAGNDRIEALRRLDEVVAIYQRLGAKRHLELAIADKVRAQGLDSVDFRSSIDVITADVQRRQPDLRSHAAPDGTVTILFSDIEGSTTMTERLGDQHWLQVLREHNRIVREQIAAHGGYEVKAQGDGFMLAFQSARRALHCAIAIQRAFAARNQQHADLPLRVRIGLHAGEVIKEADDFFGKNVILAARIAAQATGGEILVSALVQSLTHSAGDIQFAAPRDVTLKGLSGTHRLVPVAWE